MSSSFWQNKLTGKPAPSRGPVPVPSMYQPQQQILPQQQSYPQHLPPTGLPARMPDSASSGRCPSCGSSNYFEPHTPELGKMTQNGMVYPAGTCHDCGYPRVQFGSPAGAGSDVAATQNVAVGGRARQVESQKHGYRPDIIQGRIG